MEEDILVTIDCITYNHEKYIADALDGMLMQKTNFKYEIIIHDDASTDATADIIRKYEKRYPDIIKPIYQSENQYSKDYKFYTRLQFPRVNGKYHTLCEGDDYWTDENKLQTQVDYMEAHPDCTFCMHAANFVSPDGELLRPTHFAEGDMDFDLPYFIKNREEFLTASIMIPSRLLKTLPTYYYRFLNNDTPLALYTISEGYGHYINKNMANYRVSTPGSWSDVTVKLPPVQFASYKASLAALYDSLNAATKYKYNKVIRGEIQKNLSLVIERAALACNHLPLRMRLRYSLMFCFPNLYKRIKLKRDQFRSK